MKTDINSIWEYYREDLALAEEKINETLKTVAPAISVVGNHLFSSGGKRVRPLLAILSSRMFGTRGDDVSTLASSVEFIHAASLIHDDVVDGAHVRRGQPAAHSLWGNQVVILVGDFLYANALRLANLLEKQPIMDALCTATAKMSEGELIQLSKKGNPEVPEEDYLKIIQGKTAILMSAACKGGAVLGNASQKEVDALAAFGLKFGYAFQIADDVLDYMAEEKAFGKSLGKDLEEGKITLPLIYLLKDAEPKEAGRVKEIVRAENKTASDLSYVQELFQKHRSIEKSSQRAHQFLNQAKAELNIFNDSMEKASLCAIADYAVTRRK
ncbi:MAG: polyprenyl synthetase family protein [Nitrospiraceae bacterium]|nr:MAG: polyprenyl synthetase family protein [Nitrospiraceae bacterium]